jgi:DNA-binding transcriptional MerR regulator
MPEFWRIHELQAVVEHALEQVMPAPELSGRVRAVPDARTIRYYTTLGLIDRPAEIRGRTAYYQRRHALQLVSIKRLQAAGMPLDQVQQRLAGASTRKLTELAALPATFFDNLVLPDASQSTSPARAPVDTTTAERGESFWHAPAEVASALPMASPSVAPELAARAEPTPLVSCLRLPVTSDVTLELANIPLQQITPEVSRQLQPALEQLRQELRRLGLVPHSPPSTLAVPTDSSSSPTANGATHEHDADS